MKNAVKNLLVEIKNLLFIVAGVLSATLGLKSFLLPNRFIDGGVTGVSMLVSEISGVSLALLILVINLPFIFIAYRQVGLRFANRSAAAIVGLSVSVALLELPQLTSDKVLSAVFGGFFLGAGIGAAVRGSGVLDGTEIAALLLSRKSHLLRVGDVILIMNVFIFGAAAWFLGVESALYSILTYFSASKTVDFLLYGIEEYHGVMIISPKYEKIRKAVLHDLKRGMTVIKGEGGMTNREQDILYCIVTRLEVAKVKAIVREIDGSAFIVVHPIADASGGVIKKRAVHSVKN